MHPEQSLEAGANTLRTILEPHGFRYIAGDTGSSSGGPFTCGSFVKENRALEFSVRHGLGQVEYTLNGQRIRHEDYLRFAGYWGEHKYPNFGKSIQDSFTALAQDLQRYFGDFISGPGTDFITVVQRFQSDPKRFKGFATLSAR